MASHRGSVVAAPGWGRAEHYYEVPAARPGSHEALLHDAIGTPAVLLSPHLTAAPGATGGRRGRDRSWWTDRRGHRAIGVVYNPAREAGNYVPTVVGRRYDALLWFEHTAGLRPLRGRSHTPHDAEWETEPSGL
jgi:erythromycin esterase